MQILHSTAEYFPFIKMGGLSDMLSSLSRQQAKSHRVGVAIPKTKGLKESPHWTGRQILVYETKSDTTNPAVRILKDSVFREAEWKGVMLYFLDSPVFRELDGIYQNPDEHFRFAIYSYACFVLSLELKVDVFHAHDWHTALGCALHKASPWGKSTVFTIHNLAYQGDHPHWMTGFLEEEPFYLSRSSMDQNGKINYMKAGIMTADKITTVSPGYRNETLWEPNGFGLSYALSFKSENYRGILNGIDTEEWNPKIDPHIPYKYDKNSISKGKLKNKKSLLEEIQRPNLDSNRPLVGLIGRLTYQKGYETFLKAFLNRPRLNHFFLFLGAGDSELEAKLFHESHHNSDRIYFYKGYSESFARKIEAASDFFLMPSLFEPCGLNQFYSHAYGSIPIVSRVGGLRDSVDESIFEERQTGIVFEPNDADSLGFALERAETLYEDKRKFELIQKTIMQLDWSWKQRVAEYETVYEEASHR